ncbi:bacteriohopanetetrol glucosamine biosynthesis glycosyltransferase HpnI [Enterovirga sp.]|uniref:bacteriohopanetetrol glucosamine biosynthesis glycosyltransferase HpnI n=1 Tax=Enterovirga sp. TaxID=2026350 RepID=UPI00261A5F3C|nr:bacteriohopanetetrol glucosamine biosynthesis glycosyltransferase HpnI [Enterovirga sp.]MDB5591448.1 glucosyltransferase [Enterovirga sp.]
MSAAEWIWALLMGAAGLGTAYLLLSVALVRRFAAARAAAPSTPPPDGVPPAITVLKPLHGVEPGLRENLLTLLQQDYRGPVRIVFGVQSGADPAIRVVEALRRAHPARDIALVVDARQHGSNRKVSNLINMAAHIVGEVVVLADSDIRVGPDYLSGLVAELGRPGVGAVTCLYHGLASRSLWSRLSALGIDTHFLPGIVTGVAVGLATPCMGSTIALPRETLERIGGLQVVANALADDYELGAAVRRLGLSVAVPPFTLGHVCPEDNAAELIRRELRWQRTIRQIDPLGHAGSLVTHPLAFALPALALGPGPAALALVVAAALSRLALCLAAERAFGLKPHPYWLIPARDLMSLLVFAASFFGRGVDWRGHRFDVAPSGALIPTTRPDPS